MLADNLCLVIGGAEEFLGFALGSLGSEVATACRAEA